MYKIMESYLCYDKGIDTLKDAKAYAERMIEEMPFGEIGTVEIVDQDTDEVVLRWNVPAIVWEQT
jgi:hypothetical protein